MFTKMHWSDLLIIYLSCGAPFGVHFFLQNRGKSQFSRLLLRSGGAGLLWIGYSYLLWRKNIAKRLTKKENFSPDPEISLLGQQTSVLQEQILQAFIELNAKTPIKPGFFTFRDVLERYVGLTLALKAVEKTDETLAGESDFEIFRIAGRKKKELPLAGKCLARKNSMRLKFHQSKSCEDFLKLLANIAPAPAQANGNGRAQNIYPLRDLILELFELIDVKTLPGVERVFNNEENANGYLIRESEDGFQASSEIASEIRGTQCQPPAPPLAEAAAVSQIQPQIPLRPAPSRAMMRHNSE